MAHLSENVACHRSGPGWYVAQVEPRGEAKASRAIKDELGLDSYFPVERMRKFVRNRRIAVDRPLIAGYLFVEFNPYQDEWQAIERLDGVVDLLTNNDNPCRVPTAWIEAIRYSEQIGAFDRTTVAPNGFKIGDQVRIGEGPFSGHMALIKEFIAKLKSASPMKRAKVLTSFMGRMIVVELPIEAIEKA